MAKVLILEDSETSSARIRAGLQGVPVKVVSVSTAAEARAFFERGGFDIIVLDGIVPSTPGGRPSLVGPLLAREFRKEGYMGPIIVTSDDPKARELTKKGASEEVKHLTYACDKSKVPGLIRELLGNYSIPSK